LLGRDADAIAEHVAGDRYQSLAGAASGVDHGAGTAAVTTRRHDTGFDHGVAGRGVQVFEHPATSALVRTSWYSSSGWR
jgi:hypothetical protein